MKSATYLTPPSTGLSGIQFSILNLLESFNLKDQKSLADIIFASRYAQLDKKIENASDI